MFLTLDSPALGSYKLQIIFSCCIKCCFVVRFETVLDSLLDMASLFSIICLKILLFPKSLFAVELSVGIIIELKTTFITYFVALFKLTTFQLD